MRDVFLVGKLELIDLIDIMFFFFYFKDAQELGPCSCCRRGSSYDNIEDFETDYLSGPYKFSAIIQSSMPASVNAWVRRLRRDVLSSFKQDGIIPACCISSAIYET